ncbi:MAG: hypothetical protein CMO81_07645 [Waddliaceae bacterium]|nr:hypothetical protein [Waddliaceae bacterium]
MASFFRVCICIAFAGISLALYIAQQNIVIELRRKIPERNKELRELEQVLTELQYEVDSFERPIHLMQLRRKPEYGHLSYPQMKEITVLYAPEIEPEKS